jgi:hypothetical protein
MSKPLPDWLRLWFQSALISEIYLEIRAIAVGLSDERILTVRYYLDREATDFDYESIEMVVSEVLSNASCTTQIQSATEECCFSDKKMSEIDRLDGFVYARREYGPPSSGS